MLVQISFPFFFFFNARRFSHNKFPKQIIKCDLSRRWRITDFWPEGTTWQEENSSSSNLGAHVSDVDTDGNLSLASYDSFNDLESTGTCASEGGGSNCGVEGGGGGIVSFDSVNAQIQSFDELSDQLHDAIREAGEGDRSGVLGKYNKRDRARASLLTAGIKASIIDNIRIQAASRIDDPLESPLYGLEGQMAEAAFIEIYGEMTRKHGGIKVLKHPRSVGKTPRVIKIKFKKIRESELGLEMKKRFDSDSSDSENENENENESERRGEAENGNDFLRECEHNNEDLGQRKVSKAKRGSSSVAKLFQFSKARKEEGTPEKDTSSDAKDDSLAGYDSVTSNDEFAVDKWNQNQLSFHGEHAAQAPSKPFLQYRGGFMNRSKKKIDLDKVVSVKKGVQTDVLKRESRNRYRNHAFLSLEVEGENGRSFDLEVIDGDVRVSRIEGLGLEFAFSLMNSACFLPSS